MGIYKKGKIWWFIKQYKGRKVEESLGTEKKGEAERLFADKLPKILDGSYFVEKKDLITFKELAEKYVKKYKRQRDGTSLKHLLLEFGDDMITEITPEMVEDYLLERSEEEKASAPATIYQEYSLARRMFNVARKRWRLVRENPFADVEFQEVLPFDNKRVRWFTVHEERLLLSCAYSEVTKKVIIFAIHSGCRRGEILSCTWKDNIDMQKKLITVRISKKKPGEEAKFKVIPMSETLYAMMKEHNKIRSISGKVFDIDASELRYAWDRTREKAKVEDAHFHDCRHTFCTRLAQQGIDL